MGESKLLQRLLADAIDVLKRSKTKFRSAGLNAADQEDLQQEVFLRLVRFTRQHETAPANCAAYAQVVTDHAFASRIEKMRAQKRGGGERTRSLDAPLHGDTEECVGDDRVGHDLDPAASVELFEFIDTLPTHLRVVVHLRLSGMNDVEIAHSLGAHRTTVAERRTEIGRRLAAFLGDSADTENADPVEPRRDRACRDLKERNR